MAGLLGAMVAGGVSGYAKSRMDTLEKKEAFDLKMALNDADLEKNLLLKERTYQQDQSHIDSEHTRIKDTLETGRGVAMGGAQKLYDEMTPKEKFLFDANTLKNNGDLKGYDSMMARAKALEPEKETFKDFDPNHIVMNSKGNIVYNGQGKTLTFKNDEDLWSASQNPDDSRHELATKMIKAKGDEKVRVAIAGRAPRQQTEMERKANAMVKTGRFSNVDEAITSMAEAGGISAMGMVRNKEIDKARELIGNMSPDEIKRKTENYTNTGRINKDFDQTLAARVRIAGRRKVGEDAVFDGQKPNVDQSSGINVINELDSRFKTDASMKGNKLGKQTTKGVEVHDANGNLIGYYK